MLKDCRMGPHNIPQKVQAETAFRPSLYGDCSVIVGFLPEGSQHMGLQ